MKSVGAIALALVAFLALLVAGAAARAKGKPNLVVTKVSNPPAALALGTKFTVKDTTKNRGKRAAAPTTTRYYLTKNPAQSLRDRKTSTTNPRTSPTDILLNGERAVKRLGRRKSSSGSTLVTVPGGTPAGRYYLLACADDHGLVAEKKETDNCKASAGANNVAPPSGTAGRIDSFSDTYPPFDPSDAEGVKLGLKLACIAPTPPRNLTLSQAVTSANAYLTAVAGADAMAKFKATPQYNNAGALPGFAGGALAAGSPGAALAAELRAHELQPKEPAHLENAAGVAAAVGLPNEAIAFLDASVGLDSSKRASMGISRQAADLTTRGYAQLLRGQFGPAEQSEQSALAISPVLNEEASMTLAAAKACKGQDPIAAFRKGMRRQDPPEPPKLPMDESKAKATELRPFPFPATAQNAAGDRKFFDGLVKTESDRLMAQTKRITTLGDKLHEEKKTLPEISQERIDDILYIKDALFLDSDLRALMAQYQHWYDLQVAEFGKWETKYLVWYKQASDACIGAKDFDACLTAHMRSLCIPGTKPFYSNWKQEAVHEYNVAKAYQHIWSLRISALASNVKNETAYDYLLAWADDPGEIGDEIFILTLNTDVWAGALDDARDSNGTPLCIESADPANSSDPGELKQNGSGPCPPGLKAIGAEIDLSVVKVKVNCEEVKVGASTEMIPLVKAFAEVKYNFKDGTTTVFAGAKGDVGFGPAKADFKSGIYLKGDASGQIKELGWRVGPSVGVGAGPVGWSGGSDTVDIKIIGSYGNPTH